MNAIYIQEAVSDKLCVKKYDNDVCFLREDAVWKEVVAMLSRFNEILKENDLGGVHFQEDVAADIVIEHVKKGNKYNSQ